MSKWTEEQIQEGKLRTIERRYDTLVKAAEAVANHFPFLHEIDDSEMRALVAALKDIRGE